MRRLKIWRLVQPLLLLLLLWLFPSCCKTEPDGEKLLSSSALLPRQYAWRRYGGFDSTTRDTRQTLHHAKVRKLLESENFGGGNLMQSPVEKYSGRVRAAGVKENTSSSRLKKVVGKEI